MKEIVNTQTIDELKKSRKYIYGSMIIAIALASALSVPLFIFATRDLRYVFIAALAIIWTLAASLILYLGAVCLSPLNSYLKLSNASLTGNKFSTKGKIISISHKITHVQGIAVKEIKVVDLEEENKEYIFYVEQHHSGAFILDKSYTFTTYQSVIIAYEEDL